MLGRIQAGDNRVMRRLNRWYPPRWVRYWMIWAARAGDGWLWGAVGVLILLFGGGDRFAAVVSGLVAAGVAQITFRIVKRMTHRERPCATEVNCWASLVPSDRFSFPSGHTMTAFAVIVPVSLSYPGLAPVLLFCALSVAASRVVLGLHYVSDVIVGMAIGGLFGYVSFSLLGPASL
jgi:undecaprenyl-diphosphatase